MWCYLAVQTQYEHPIESQPLRRVKGAQGNILRPFLPLSLPCQLNEWQTCPRQLPLGIVEPVPSLGMQECYRFRLKVDMFRNVLQYPSHLCGILTYQNYWLWPLTRTLCIIGYRSVVINLKRFE